MKENYDPTNAWRDENGDTEDIGKMENKLIYVSKKQFLLRLNTKVKKVFWVSPFPIFHLSCTVGNSMNMKEAASFIPVKVRIVSLLILP